MLLALARIVVDVPHRAPLAIASLLVFAAVFAIAFVATRTRPAYGLAVLVLADPFDYAHAISLTTLTTTKVALLGVALALAATRASLAPLRARTIAPLLGGAIAIALATALTAIPGIYIDAVARETLKALEYLAIFLVATVAGASRGGFFDDDRPVWYALYGVVVLVAALAVTQEVTTAPAAVLIGSHVVARVAGPLEGPNQLAGFFDIAIPLVFARLLARRGAIVAMVLGIALLADVLTLSRAGAIGLFVGLATVALFMGDARTRRTIAATTTIVGTLALALLGSLGVLGRLFSASDVDTASGLGSRADLWHAAVVFWRANPLLGIGAGNFELSLAQLGLFDVRTHANNLYLQALAEGGIVLFAAIVWAIVAAVRVCLVRAPREALFVGVGAATLALAAHQVLDFLTFFPKIGGFWWLWLGIAAGSLVRREAAAAAHASGARGSPVAARALVGSVAALTLAIVAWGHPHAKAMSDVGRAPVAAETGWRVPRGVTYPAARTGAYVIDGLYPGIGADDVCCWLGLRARIPIAIPRGARRADVTVLVPAYAIFVRDGQTLDVRIGATHERFTALPPGIHRLGVDVPASGAPASLEIASERDFNPKREGFNTDPRDLGVILRAVTFQ